MDIDIATDFDFSPFAYSGEEAAKYAMQRIHQHWESEENWPDLKPATWARKTTGKMLLETGQYIKSWSIKSSKAGFEIGSNSELAKFHELGTRNMPARQMAYLKPDEVDKIAEMLADQMGESI